MKTYTIGEALSRFESVNDMAFHFKGEMKGTIIYVDIENEDRLTSIYPSGQVEEGFFIKLGKNVSLEESRNIVFLNEVDEKDTQHAEGIQIILEAQKAIERISKLFLDEFDKLSEEEKEGTMEELKQYLEEHKKHAE